MPELPEVETVVSQLREVLIGQRLDSFDATEKGTSALGGMEFSVVRNYLEKKELTDIIRHGKYMLWEFEGRFVVSHLRMTGNFLLLPYSSGDKSVNDNSSNDKILDLLHVDGDIGRYGRLYLNFAHNKVVFTDKRRFGTFHMRPEFEEAEGSISERLQDYYNLGPDALDDEFNSDYFEDVLKGRRKTIFSALLDQKLVAGIGNIYANEALFRAGIHPESGASSVPKDYLKSLVTEIKLVLQESIQLQGTSFSDFSTTQGKTGSFQDMLQVYGKKRTLYENNLVSVDKLKISGRGVYVVPKLQKMF